MYLRVMLQVSALYIYPIKSLGGVSVESSMVTDRGLENDRRWMLVDEHAQFLTQREHAQLALLKVEIKKDGLLVSHKTEKASLLIPFEPEEELLTVEIWSNSCKAKVYNSFINDWFSHYISMKCRLVYMPDSTHLKVDSRYAKNKEITSFSDGYPFLIIGEASLSDLNHRLTQNLSINRFRPNIVFSGGQPFEEDEWEHFLINNVDFYGVKPSARCVVTTIDQNTALSGKEPLKTLATYRKRNNKIYFGQNLLHKGSGYISIGDMITIKTKKPSPFL